MKKALTTAVVISLIFSLAISVWALEPGEGADFYVYDEPGVLSQATKDSIYELNGLLEEEYGAQLFIVFVDYFGSADPDEFAVGLFNDWQISDRGMLLVASVKEEQGGMTVGSEITHLFTQEDIETYLDKYFADDFFDGKYDDAVITLSGKLAQWYDSEFGGDVSGSAGLTEKESSSGGFWAGIAAVTGAVFGFLFRNIFIILIFVAILVVIINSDRRRYRGYYSSMGMPMPRYRPWFIFVPSRPYRAYRPPRPTPPNPPRPSAPSRGHTGGFGDFGSTRTSTHSSPRPSARPSSGFRPSGRGMGGRSGGSFGGFSRRK